ncbi:hypothetical protein D3C80_807150 [compost metagenome]
MRNANGKMHATVKIKTQPVTIKTRGNFSPAVGDRNGMASTAAVASVSTAQKISKSKPRSRAPSCKLTLPLTLLA